MCMGALGHFVPIVRIVAALEKAGHEVLAISANGYEEERFRKVMEHHGVKAPLLCPEHHPKAVFFKGFENADDETKGPDFKATLFTQTDDRVVKPHEEAVAQLKPDLILADFYSGFPMIVADRLGIPTVVNCPAPLSLCYMDKLPGITAK